MNAPNPGEDYGLIAMAQHLVSDYDHGLVSQAILEFDGGPNRFIFGWLPPRTMPEEPLPSFHHLDRGLQYALNHLEHGEGRFVPQPCTSPTPTPPFFNTTPFQALL